MTGVLKPVANYLYTNVNKIYFTTRWKGDPPVESKLYISTLAEMGFAFDNIDVTPVTRDEDLVVPFQIDSNISNCGVGIVTSTVNSKTYNLDSATFLYTTGGDMVQMIKTVDSVDVIAGETRVMSRSGSQVVVQDDFSGITKIRLMIGWCALCVGTTPVKWFPLNIYKSSGDNYPQEADIIVS